MPATVTPYLVGVWFCVGFFVGVGWALATWSINRFLNRVFGP